VGLVPQQPELLLYAGSVAAECAAADDDFAAEPGTARALLDRISGGIDPTVHPRDLSEGQRLELALAVILSGSPEVLLLDEPTRGLDYGAKKRLGEVLTGLAAQGTTVLLATHDVELAAEVADRVVILADGEVVTDGPAREVLASSPAFAPQVTKVLLPQTWLTVAEVAGALARIA
jgi:energy-coupling factor transport system ATP-binding protein